MPRVRSRDPEQIACRSAHGVLWLLGAVCLIVGPAVMAFPLWEGLVDRTARPWPWELLLVLLVVGGVLTVIGICVVFLRFGQWGAVLDRRRGTVTWWGGPLGPMRRKEQPLSRFQAVTLSREHGWSKRSETIFRLRLVAPEVGEARIDETIKFEEVRRLGEELAKFAGLALIDRTMDTAIVREAGTLDESLRERAVRTGQQTELPDAPPDPLATERVTGDTLTFDLPGLCFRRDRGRCWAGIAGLVVVAAFLGGVPVAVLWEEFGPSVAGPVAALVLAYVVRLAFVRTRLEVSPRELRLLRVGVFRTRATVIPADRLEEVEIVPGSKIDSRLSQEGMFGDAPVILARSDETTLAFGAGLWRDELEWIQAVILSVVTTDTGEGIGGTEERV